VGGQGQSGLLEEIYTRYPTRQYKDEHWAGFWSECKKVGLSLKVIRPFLEKKGFNPRPKEEPKLISKTGRKTDEENADVIFFVSTFCARAKKAALSLLKRGLSVKVFALRPTEVEPYLPQPNKFVEKDIAGILHRLKPSVVHIHNPPDWLTVRVREHFSGTIIHDFHDSAYIAHGSETFRDWEQKASEAADILVFATSGMRSEMLRYLKTKKPSYVVPNYPFLLPMSIRKDRKLRDYDHIPHGVFIGSLYNSENAKEFQKWIADQPEGWKLHIHTNYVFLDHSTIWGRNIARERQLELLEIPTYLRRYDFGIVDGSTSRQAWYSMPNKLYDYLSAGLPVLVHPTRRHCADFVEKRGWGITSAKATRKHVEALLDIRVEWKECISRKVWEVYEDVF